MGLVVGIAIFIGIRRYIPWREGELEDPIREHIKNEERNASGDLLQEFGAEELREDQMPAPNAIAVMQASRHPTITFVHDPAEWPEGISDGLTLPCGMCGLVPHFDYSVTEEMWGKVVPPDLRLGVVCLPCLDRCATEEGVDVGQELLEVQFTGAGKTVVLWPTRIVYYGHSQSSAAWLDAVRAILAAERTKTGPKDESNDVS